jgi:GMP synthase (glutamine-hydrolysing)
MDRGGPVVAVIHHLAQPFLGHAGPALRSAREHFDALPDLDDVDAIVSLGGEQSVLDGRLEAEAALLRAAVARDVPVLGVCLGAQLLAHALGGTVMRRPRRLVAWTPLRTLAQDPVLGALPAGAYGLHWNEDGFEPPPGAVELLARPDGFCEGFRVGRAWGVQFHPEVDAAALDGWYAAWGDVLAPAGVTEAHARAADARHLPGQAALSDAIFGGFVQLVHARA